MAYDIGWSQINHIIHLAETAWRVRVPPPALHKAYGASTAQIQPQKLGGWMAYNLKVMSLDN